MTTFISKAIASSDSQVHGNTYYLIIMLVIFGLIFYFMILRPQQNRAKEHKKLINSISKGDEILTNGGLIGRVTKISETDYIIIALNDTLEVSIKRNFIAAVLPRGTIKSI
ncbi:preprotein translocase subunit YajC [Candidatus Arsenophonus lipoptenae]|uniref:Sec translocon accessory complex subunit YajC n=1 Tax=Candidatus Arsenophonus lipoptenae TaxID=634113 RepID=A0A0X9VUG5_9GAMM|nr:preprotein translocase subunit YajC [Candidatus Arsenophonus lipoptenae]AMA64818.1 preprotein translocase subunit YajC [Candidatus Arsenophonus lipoptenae]